tara:strand:- start:391 stop:834 length:444 start_codon:yes stop_codon:yes gene_type:complete
MSPTQQNYNPLANTPCNNCCIPNVYGCEDPNALNYYAGMVTPGVGCDVNGSTNCCVYDITLPILDCADPTATNYNSDPLVIGCDNYSGFCDDPSVTGYNPQICAGNTSCCTYTPTTPQKPGGLDIGDFEGGDFDPNQKPPPGWQKPI